MSHGDRKDANCTATARYFAGTKELGEKIKRKKKFFQKEEIHNDNKDTTYVLKVDWESVPANKAFFFPL